MFYYFTPEGQLRCDVIPVDEDFHGISNKGITLPIFEVVTWEWAKNEMGNKSKIEEEFPNFDIESPFECIVDKKDGSYSIILSSLDHEKIRTFMKRVLMQEIFFINPNELE